MFHVQSKKAIGDMSTNCNNRHILVESKTCLPLPRPSLHSRTSTYYHTHNPGFYPALPLSSLIARVPIRLTLGVAILIPVLDHCIEVANGNRGEARRLDAVLKVEVTLAAGAVGRGGKLWHLVAVGVVVEDVALVCTILRGSH